MHVALHAEVLRLLRGLQLARADGRLGHVLRLVLLRQRVYVVEERVAVLHLHRLALHDRDDVRDVLATLLVQDRRVLRRVAGQVHPFFLLDRHDDVRQAVVGADDHRLLSDGRRVGLGAGGDAAHVDLGLLGGLAVELDGAGHLGHRYGAEPGRQGQGGQPNASLHTNLLMYLSGTAALRRARSDVSSPAKDHLPRLLS